jgi:hypothetical protein
MGFSPIAYDENARTMPEFRTNKPPIDHLGSKEIS